MVKRRVPGLLAALVLLSSGCGGGGGGSAPTGVPPTAAPSSSPAQATATFTLSAGAGSSITGGRRAPRYVSTATKSLAIAVNGASSTAILNLGDPAHCDASGACSIGLSAPVGSDTFVVSAYDATNGTGDLLSRATVQAVIAASGSTVSAVLDGNVASTTVSLANASPKLHQAASIPVTVSAFDARGKAIVGPGGYLYPVQLTNSDTSGHTALTATQLDGPNDTVSLRYDGGYAVATITAGGQNVLVSGSATLSPSVTATETTLTNGNTAVGIVPGPDGAMWFASRPGMIGRIATDGSVTQFIGPPAGWDPYSLRWGPDGALWIVATNDHSTSDAVFRQNSGGGYLLVSGPAISGTPSPLVTGPDGNLWFTAFYAAYKVTTSGTYAAVSMKDKSGNVLHPQLPVAGPDNAMWFTGDGGLIRNDLGTAAVTTFPVQPSAVAVPVTPASLALGPDARLYLDGLSFVMSCDPSGALTTLEQQPNGPPYGVMAFASDGGLWFTAGNAPDGTALFARMAGNVPVPIAGAAQSGTPRSIDSMASGPDGALWYTRGPAVGRIVP